jgi:hypothetical protein
MGGANVTHVTQGFDCARGCDLLRGDTDQVDKKRGRQTEAAPQSSGDSLAPSSRAGSYRGHVTFGAGAIAIRPITNDNAGTWRGWLIGNSASHGRWILNNVKLGGERRRRERNSSSKADQQALDHGPSPCLIAQNTNGSKQASTQPRK